jgi:outer membrane protein OmpA-like peptidoglycan-associated protein
MAHAADSHDTHGDHHAAATVADGPGSGPGEWLVPLVFTIALTAITLWALLAPRAAFAPPVAARPPVVAPGALGAMVEHALADGSRISVPERGVEGRLLAFIRDPAQRPDKTTWFDFDRLTFETGSATLGEGSRDQLASVAAILAAFPAVKLKIGGYTDDVGDAALNQQLSAQRAASVQAMLVHLGVAQDRLAAEGYGEQFPVGDNATPEGRAMNRRISMRVVEK